MRVILTSGMFASIWTILLTPADAGRFSFLQIDQQQIIQDGSNNSGGLGLDARKGQTFIPSFEEMDLVEILLVVNSGSQFLMNVRETDLQGTVLGTSRVSTIPDPHYGYTSPVQFYFPSAVSLIPGQTYAWELVPVYLSGTGFTVRLSISDVYPGGVYFASPDSPHSSVDAWFRQGIAVPEPSGVILGVMSLVAFAYWRPRRRLPLSVSLDT